MREVDTAALTRVSRSLGVGNPAGVRSAVVFDDGNLQQVWDATKWGQLPNVQGLLQTSFAAGGASSVARIGFTLDALFNPGVSGDYESELADADLDIGNADVWLVDYQVKGLDSNVANLDEAMCGYSLNGAEDPIILFRGKTAASINPLEVTGLYVPILRSVNLERRPLPVRLTGRPNVSQATELIHCLVDSTGGGDTEALFQFRLAFTLKGTPLWYAV